MAYPTKMKDTESEDVVPKKGDLLPEPAATMPLPKTEATGGAPELPEAQKATVHPLPTFQETGGKIAQPRPEGWVPIYQRQPNQPPDREVLYPPSPWKREDVDTHWGDLIEEMGTKLWERYQALDPKQKAMPIWQQVGKNPQEAARSMVLRVLMGQGNVPARKMGQGEITEEQRLSMANQKVYQWFRFLQRGWS
jgi:hypothetical protein